jgi:serine/threonine-protein kinase
MTRESDVPIFVPEGYRTLHRLGAGQTSQVYLAQNERYGQVALKIPREALAHRPVLRRMFENEVQITLKLDHPHVVRGFAGYPTGPNAYLALEYCAGGTLDQLLLEKGRMPLDRSLQLILDVAAGLWFTHDARVLHRDVKPANVFLDDRGRAKLGDFGTGTFMAEDNEERVGTAFYMAPEIFEGSTSTQRSDIYSLGVLAYEVLTGVRPFLGDSYDALMVAHLTDLPRDLRRYREDLDRGVALLVLKAMSRDADKRFGTVAEFVAELRKQTGLDVLDTAPEQAPRAQVGRKSRATRTAETDAAAAASEGSESHARSRQPEREADVAEDPPTEESEGEDAKRPGFLQRLFGLGKER